MVRWDPEGHPHRSFLPHLLALGLALALWLLAGAAAPDPPAWLPLWLSAWLSGDLPAAVVRAALDPVTLLLAGLAGWLLLRHRQLLPALLGLGLVIGYGIDFVDFSAPGTTAPTALVAARVLACLAVGYLANALRLLLAPPGPRF